MDTNDATPAKAGGFTVKLSAFEGPLDLLLHLIEGRKLHISDVSLAQITDDYLAYLEKLEEFPLRDAAHFILVASTLVLIKSRSLVPALTLSDEEEASIEDLEARLKLYREIKALGKYVEERFGAAQIFFREDGRHFEPVFAPSREITVAHLAAAVAEVIARLPTVEAIPQAIVRKVVNLEDMMSDLARRVASAISMSFREFAGGGGGTDKARLVVGFLAMLELVKRGIITVKQDRHFEDIKIGAAAPGAPRYL